MSQTAVAELFESPVFSSNSYGAGMDDDSPFGLQGLTRDTLQILKPDCIERLAVMLAIRGTNQQIRDMDFVLKQLSFRKEWLDEYRIVHLIEKSLWIQGHSDLVMTMTKNPSQIPDNPPPKIMQALSRAYSLHPQATVWYGVPLFSEEKNEEGLPIPVTAAEVLVEAKRRIVAAQQNALRWGWLYRTILRLARLPSTCWGFGRKAYQGIVDAKESVVKYLKKTRREVRERSRAAIIAELERCRFGCAMTVIPASTTLLGRGIDAGAVVMELIESQSWILEYLGAVAPFLSTSIAPVFIASFIPKMLITVTVISADPFLFVELPEEPGKLRHIGHWYWQDQPKGKQKLHLHL